LRPLQWLQNAPKWTRPSSSAGRASRGHCESMLIVIKIGTSSLIRKVVSADGSETSCVKLSAMASFVEVIVTSGAVGLGCVRCGLDRRPSDMGALQAMAAVGQIALARLYDDFFTANSDLCAQVLLTYSTFGSRAQYDTAKVSGGGVMHLAVAAMAGLCSEPLTLCWSAESPLS
jgi:glutamate 5-kinase